MLFFDLIAKTLNKVEKIHGKYDFLSIESKFRKFCRNFKSFDDLVFMKGENNRN